MPTGAALSRSSNRQWMAIPLISVLWGMNWPTQGLALREIPPWTMRAVTLCGVAVVLLLLSAFRRQSLRVSRSEWPVLLGFTFFFVVALNVLISFAQLIAPTGRTALVTFTMPIWTTLLAAIYLHEPLTRVRKVGLAFGTFGLLVLIVPTIQAGTYVGWLLALAGAWCWSISTIIVKRYPLTASPLAVVTWQFVIGSALVSIGMVTYEGLPFHRTMSTSTALAMAYNVLSQSVAQLIWFETLTRVPAALAALGVLLVPGVAMLGSIVLLHQVPTALDCIGLVLISCASASVQIPWGSAGRGLRKSLERRRGKSPSEETGGL